MRNTAPESTVPENSVPENTIPATQEDVPETLQDLIAWARESDVDLSTSTIGTRTIGVPVPMDLLNKGWENKNQLTMVSPIDLADLANSPAEGISPIATGRYLDEQVKGPYQRSPNEAFSWDGAVVDVNALTPTQWNDYSCGAATSCSALIPHVGVREFWDKIQELAGPDLSCTDNHLQALEKVLGTNSEEGTSPRGLINLVHQFENLDVIKVPQNNENGSVEDLVSALREGYSVIVDMLHPEGDVGHYTNVVAINEKQGTILLGDPWSGPEMMLNIDDFIERWHDDNIQEYPDTSDHTQRWFLALRKQTAD